MKLHLIGACGLILVLTGCGSNSVTEETSIPATATVGARVMNRTGDSSVSLAQGWNAVGFPSANLTGLASSTSVQTVSWWDGQNFQTGPATAETVQGAGTWHGFWIYASEATSLAYSGDAAAPPAVPLTSGWNLVAFSQEVLAASLECVQGSQTSTVGTFTEAASGRAATTLGPGVAYWVYSPSSGTLQPKSDHTVRFVNLQFNALAGHPFAVQVEALKPDGTPDRGTQSTVTLSPTGQTAQFSGSTAIFPAVVFSQPGLVHLTIREGGRDYQSADVNVVSPPPSKPEQPLN